MDRLIQSRHRPLALVSAPAGYGKSTLVSCWLQACNVLSAWVSLDENDNDLRIFLSYFVSAIQSVFPVACAETRSMLGLDPLPPVSLLAKSLTNELDQIEKAFILVLDDFHFIRDKLIHKLITKLLHHPAASIQLVLITRRDPSLPLIAMRAKGQMIEIRTRDLRFSLEETLAFLNKMTGAPVDSAIAAILEEKTEGWVTGLRLAALSMRLNKEIARKLAELPTENRYVMDYVVTEILAHYPPAVQARMMKTSVLGRFCAPLCEAVCRSADDGGPKGREFLELLENDNLFVIPLDEERKWFRFHHLFQALLKRQLKQRFNTEDIVTLHSRASAWFDENGYIEEALWHAHEGGDLAVAARLVKNYRHAIMNSEKWYQLNRWLQKFPPEFIQDHPDLLMAKAWTYQRQARYSELFAILDRFEDKVSASVQECVEDSIFRGEVQVLKSFQFYSTGQGELSAITARKALDCFPSEYHSVRGFAVLILSGALQMQGDQVQGRRVVLEALQQEKGSTTNYKTALLAALCFPDWIAADLNNLRHSAAQLLKHGQQQRLPEAIVLGSFFNGIIHFQRNELDLAERFLVSVVGPPRSSEWVVPSIVTYCQSAFALSLTYQAMGRAREASQTIGATMDYMMETSNADLLELCQVFRADLALHQGYVTEADVWIRSHPPMPLAPAYRFYTPQLITPKVLLTKRTAKSLSEAESLLCRMQDFYGSIHSTRVLIDILILQAMVHAARDNESPALEKVAEALALAEPGRFIRPFLDQGPEMADLLSRLEKHRPTLQYAMRILETFENHKNASFGNRSEDFAGSLSSLSNRPMIEPLTNREIEVLRMLNKGTSNNDIAQRLFISPETVKRHLSTIYRKLDVKNRQQALIRAKSIGIL
ncbi:MAG: LuxR C-terminal-related transcriptional regulator [Desulfosarcina sp.]